MHINLVYLHKIHALRRMDWEGYISSTIFNFSSVPYFPTGRYYAKLLKLQNVQLTQIKGISSMQTFDLSKEEGFGGEEKQDLKGEEEQEDSELLKE